VSIPLISALEGTQQGVFKEEPQTVAPAGTRPPRNNAPALRTDAPAKGVSTDRRASQRGEYEKFSHSANSTRRHHSPLSRGSRAETTTPVSTTHIRTITAKYTSAMQGNFQYNNALGSPMFAFPRHKYRIRTMHTQENSTYHHMGAIWMYASTSMMST
jgi:hypothetical protein